VSLGYRRNLMAHNVASASDTQTGTRPQYSAWSQCRPQPARPLGVRRQVPPWRVQHADAQPVRTSHGAGVYGLRATLAEFNGEADHAHLLVQYPPKVALSHLVNSLKGVVSSRRLRQDFVNRINKAAMHGRFWSPSYSAGSCGGPALSTVQDYITNQKRPD
jgi:putative transposase